MLRNVILSSLSVALFSFTASAQTPSQGSATSSSVAPDSWKNITSQYLEHALKLANQHLATVKPLHLKEIEKGADFDLCKADLLKLQRQYDEWFVARKDKFAEMMRLVDQELARAAQKVVALQSSPIAVVAVPGQDASEVTVNLADMIQYLRNYNLRLSSCPSPQKREALQRALQDDPSFNPWNISYSQVMTAMEQMTARLNASLKESSSQYELAFVKGDCNNSLTMKVKISAGGFESQLDLPVLDETFLAQKMSEAEKWQLLKNAQAKLDTYSVDGRLRYIEMQNKLRQQSCKNENWSVIATSGAARPYEIYEELSVSKVVQVDRRNLNWTEISREGSVGGRVVGLGLTTKGQLYVNFARDTVLYTNTPQWQVVRDEASREVTSNRLHSNLGQIITWGGYNSAAIINDTFRNVPYNHSQSTAMSPDTEFVYHFNSNQFFASSIGTEPKVIAEPATKGASCRSAFSIQVNSKNKIFAICSQNYDPRSIEAKGTLIVAEHGDGTKKWATSDDRELVDIALMNDHELLAVGADGNLYRYDLNEPNKQKQWTLFQAAFDVRMPIERVAASPSGRICIAQLGGKIFCLE